jgi:hypothetical protein
VDWRLGVKSLRMERQKKFHVVGRVRPTRQPKESDGVDYNLGHYDSLQDAEAVKRERLACGWGRIEITESED